MGVKKKRTSKSKERMAARMACVCRHNENVYRAGAQHTCILPEARNRYGSLVGQLEKRQKRLRNVQQMYQVAQVIHQVGHTKGRPSEWWDAVNGNQFTIKKDRCYKELQKLTDEIDTLIDAYLGWLDAKVAPDLMDRKKHPNHALVCEYFRSITTEVMAIPYPSVKKWAGKKYLPAMMGESKSVWSPMFSATFASQVTAAYAMMAQDAMPYLFLKGSKYLEAVMNRLFDGKKVDGQKIRLRFSFYTIQWEDIFKTHELHGSILKLKEVKNKLPTGVAAKNIQVKINIKAFTKNTNALIATVGAAAFLMNVLYIRGRSKKDWINTGAGALAFVSAVLDWTAARKMVKVSGGVPVPGVDKIPKNLQTRLFVANVFGRVAIGIGGLVAGWDVIEFWGAGDNNAAGASAFTAAGCFMCLAGGAIGAIGALISVVGVLFVAMFTDPPLLKWAKTCPYGIAPHKDSAKKSLKNLNKIMEDFRDRRVQQLIKQAEQIRFNARPLPAGIHKVEPKQLISAAERLENEAILLSLRKKA